MKDQRYKVWVNPAGYSYHIIGSNFGFALVYDCLDNIQAYGPLIKESLQSLVEYKNEIS